MRKLTKILLMISTLCLLLGAFAVFASAEAAVCKIGGTCYNSDAEAYASEFIETDALFVVLNTETGEYISHGTTFDDFYNAVNRPSTEVATTLKLLDDIDFTRYEYISIEGSHKPFTIDLNGKTLDTQNATRFARTDKNRGVFRPVGTDGAVFNLTSSKPGALVTHTKPKNATAGDPLIWITTNNGITVNIDGGITYFGARFVTVNGNSLNSSVNISNTTMIQTGSDGQAFLQMYGAGAALNVSDSKIYVSTSGANVLAGNSADITASFDSCEILGGTNGQVFFEPSATQGVLGTVTFNDCKIFANIAPYTGTSTKVVLAGDTIINSSSLAGVTVESGRTITEVFSAGVKTDSKYSGFGFADDVNYDFVYQKTGGVDYTFTHTTIKDADLAKIEWTYGDEVSNTAKYIPGLEPQEYTFVSRINDGYILKIYSGSYTAALEKGIVRRQLTLTNRTCVDGLMYNLSLDSSMSINLAIPKNAYEAEGFAVTDGERTLKGKLITIDREQYYIVAIDSINALMTTVENAFVLRIGDAESQTLGLSVANYASQLLANGKNYTERELARAILQYALDAERTLGENNADAISKITELLGDKVDRGMFPVSFGTVHDTNVLASTELYGACLRLDSTPGFVFSADADKTASFTVKYGSTTKNFAITEAGGEAVLDIKVYDFDTEMTITVGGVDYSYNLATYLNGLCNQAAGGSEQDLSNTKLARSIYNYVKASKTYFYGDNMYSTVRYSEFGADPTGLTDSFDAIVATHEYANAYGLKVEADAGATYYIGHHLKEAIIKTDTDWKDAKFIIDDTNTPKNQRNYWIFRISPDTDSYYLNLDEIELDISKFKKNSSETGLVFDTPVMLHIVNSKKKVYLRAGANSGQDNQQEIVVVDENGRLDESTPFIWDYEEITSIKVIPINERKITVQGGEFTTRVNLQTSASNYYARGIFLGRSNATVYNVKHYLDGEPSTVDGSCPYSGFFYAENAAYASFEKCVMTGHRTYKTTQSDGDVVSQGNYDTQAVRCFEITWKDCTQSNDYNASKDSEGYTIWGVMASNFCKNLVFDGCYLSRFDAHRGVHNVTIKNSEVGEVINLVGSGTATFINTKLSRGQNNYFIRIREDYGATWEGDIVIENCTLVSSSSSKAYVIRADWINWDFGYTCYAPNVYINGLTVVTKSGATVSPSNIYIFKNFRTYYDSGYSNKTGHTYYSNSQGSIIANNSMNINPLVVPSRIETKNFAFNTYIEGEDTYDIFATTTKVRE